MDLQRFISHMSQGVTAEDLGDSALTGIFFDRLLITFVVIIARPVKGRDPLIKQPGGPVEQ